MSLCVLNNLSVSFHHTSQDYQYSNIVTTIHLIVPRLSDIFNFIMHLPQAIHDIRTYTSINVRGIGPWEVAVLPS